MTTLKAPFPYFGGKNSVADLVWSAIGDCRHYIEPFCGSCAVLLARPNHHSGDIETVNDADGHICNVWRALQSDPDAVARWCDWPVNHADLIARKRVLNERNAELLDRLCADDLYYDSKLAGYYVWSASCWIGSGMICPNHQRPHISNGGMGVHAKGQRPHIGDGGQGVHAKGQRPHIGDGGQGVHAKGQIPHISAGGKGVHAKGQRPHISDGGMGVQEAYNHNTYTWLRALAERLRYVRVVCGDWTRVCGGNWQDKLGVAGIFFDPPYSDVATRDKNCYAVDSESVAHDVREWCRVRGSIKSYRIVLAGYYEEHESLLEDGWTVTRWSAQGGYGNTGGLDSIGKSNRHREALFMSPHCLSEALLF